MFIIEQRIVDDFTELTSISTEAFDSEARSIYGYIRVSFNSHEAGGYYHSETLRIDEFGGEMLNVRIMGLNPSP